jgi:hypothetical protein
MELPMLKKKSCWVAFLVVVDLFDNISKKKDLFDMGQRTSRNMDKEIALSS